MRRIFPFALDVQHRAGAIEERSSLAKVAAQEPMEVLADFMRIAGNRELTEAETQVLEQSWEHTRAAHEKESA